MANWGLDPDDFNFKDAVNPKDDPFFPIHHKPQGEQMTDKTSYPPRKPKSDIWRSIDLKSSGSPIIVQFQVITPWSKS